MNTTRHLRTYSKHLETKFDTSDYELERPLSKDKNKKVNGLMKNEIGRNVMTEFAALRPKPYS